MKKVVTGVVITSALFGLIALAMYFSKNDPKNKDGYSYKDHFYHAAYLDSGQTTLVWDNTVVDSYAIYMPDDSTLVVETPDTTHYLWVPAPPPIELPYYYTVKRITGVTICFNMKDQTFYSVYKFPPDSTGKYSIEVWPGAEPGVGEPDSLDLEVLNNQEVLFGWIESIPDTVPLADSTGVHDYEVKTVTPTQAAVYDLKKTLMVDVDSLPKPATRAVRIP